MSYDVYLTIDTGNGSGATVFDRNMTSNVARMWRHAGCDIAEFDGKPATELADALEDAIEAMLDDPATYRAMNPQNGWGSYESCLLFLHELHIGCVRHPATTVSVSR